MDYKDDYKAMCNELMTVPETLYYQNLVTDDAVMASLAEQLLTVLKLVNSTFVTDKELKKAIVDMENRSYDLIKHVKRGEE